MQRLIFFLAIFFFSCIQITFGAVIFEDDFESGNLSKVNENTGAIWAASNSGQSDYVTVSSENSHSGNYSLKFFFAGNSNLNDVAWAEQRFNLGQTQTELFMRFYIYFPSNYKIRTTGGTNNTKFFNIWGTNYSDPMTIDMEIEATNGAYMKTTRAGYPSYLTCSGHVGVVPGLSPWRLSANNLGRWNCFEVHLKRDSGAGDGAIQLWIDGDIVIDGTNLSWAGAPCSPGYFLNGYLMGWSNSGFNEDTSVYIDDVVFSDSYIGPIGDDQQADNQPPFTSNHSSAKNAVGIAADSNIVAHIQDSGDGVAQSTIVMKVNGQTVSPIIEGDPSNYTLTYNPPLDFEPGQTVNVTIEAADLHTPPNVMQADSYSFTIASSGQSKPLAVKGFEKLP